MLYEYLISPRNFTHVLMLDADAALVKHSLDILGALALGRETRNFWVSNKSKAGKKGERERIH